jgi:hypothetical protein
VKAHNTQKKHTSMSPPEFERAIPASDLQQTNTLDRAATGTGEHLAPECYTMPTRNTKLCNKRSKYILIYNIISLLLNNCHPFAFTDKTNILLTKQFIAASKSVTGYTLLKPEQLMKR